MKQQDSKGHVIRAMRTSRIAAWWGAALMCNLLTWGIFFANVADPSPDAGGIGMLLLVLSPFQVAGVGVIIAALVATRRFMKYRHATLQLDRFPAIVGGRLSGNVTIPGCCPNVDHATAWLVCSRVYRTGTRENRRTHEFPLWGTRHYLAVTDEGRGIGMPFTFSIPYDCEPSCSDTPPIRWKLTVRLEMPGVDFLTDFEIPVLRTSESDPSIAADPNAGMAEDAAGMMERDGVLWKQHGPEEAVLKADAANRRHPELARTGILAVLIAFGIFAALGYVGFLWKVGVGLVFAALALAALAGVWPLCAKYARGVAVTITRDTVQVDVVNVLSGKCDRQTVPRIRVLAVADRFANERHGELFHDILLEFNNEARQRQKLLLLPVVSDRYHKHIMGLLRKTLGRG